MEHKSIFNTRYCVVVNQPGCLPDNPPVFYETFKEAQDALFSELQTTIELGEEVVPYEEADEALSKVATVNTFEAIRLGGYVHEIRLVDDYDLEWLEQLEKVQR